LLIRILRISLPNFFAPLRRFRLAPSGGIPQSWLSRAEFQFQSMLDDAICRRPGVCHAREFGATLHQYSATETGIGGECVWMRK
jgi:hypothetical protein